jgi:predicted alpha-1,6-mannanase (GH76 family)
MSPGVFTRSPAGRVFRALRDGLSRRNPLGTARDDGGAGEFPPDAGGWDAGTGTEDGAPAAARRYRACAAAGIRALHRWYNPATGLWNTAGWWNAANALNAVIQYTQRTGDRSYTGVIERTFGAAQRAHPNFINDYYDDNGWWALSWIAAYDLTGDPRYLEMAKAIFAQMTTGWDNECGGGVWWTTSRTYKNAIPNELLLLLAARLHQRTQGDSGPGSYLDWALREWEWFRASGMIGTTGLVNDGLTPACENNGGTTWTYNQGVILGGLAALHEITGDPGHLEQGNRIAGAVLRYLTSPATPERAPEDAPGQALAAGGEPAGILIEPCERSGKNCNGDQTQFKGIFIRNLYDFYRQSPRPAYRAFILANARSIWENDRNRKNQFGMRWTGPFDRADAARQSSALDALNAAVALTAAPSP